MTQRPMLIFNGKPRRYETLSVWLCSVGGVLESWMPLIDVDEMSYRCADVSFGKRPSGRRVIWVHAEEDGGKDRES